MKLKQLNEATLGDVAKAEQEIDNVDKIESEDKGIIWKALDETLEINKEQHYLGLRNFQNLLLIGEAGAGKTSIVRAWAKANNINLFEVRAAGMDDTDLGGILGKGEGEKKGVAVRLASIEFDSLNEPNSVLFLDEYNRAPVGVRSNLLELINSHVIRDPRVKGEQRYLPNFLFTVAAINPATSLYDTNVLDMAEKTRFRNMYVNAEKGVTLSYLKDTLKQMADRATTLERKQKALNRINLITTLLSSKDFEFDDQQDIETTVDKGNGLALNARTLTNLIISSDGTKKDFLSKWNDFTNSLKKPMAERILSNYKDIDDKANQALSGTESEVFKKVESSLDKVKKKLKDLPND